MLSPKSYEFYQKQKVIRKKPERDPVIKKLDDFLQKSSELLDLPSIQIIGIGGIGKTQTICHSTQQQAGSFIIFIKLWISQDRSKPAKRYITGFFTLNFGSHSFNQPIKNLWIRNRGSDLDKLAENLRRAIEIFQGPYRNEISQTVIWYRSIPEFEELNEMVRALPSEVLNSCPTIKIIEESNKAREETTGQSPKNRREKKEQPIKIPPFNFEEVNDFIGGILAQEERFLPYLNLIQKALLELCGYHPYLLYEVCSKLVVEIANFEDLEPQNDVPSMITCIEQLLTTEFLDTKVKPLWDSLDEELRNAVLNNESHAQLSQGGLLLDYGQPTWRIVRLLRTYRDRLPGALSPPPGGPPESSTQILSNVTTQGDKNMDIGSIISNYAWNKAKEKGGTALKQVWREIFPPTPLYIKALEEAVGEVQNLWGPDDSGKTPDLDVKKAMEHFNYDIDINQINSAPVISRDEIKKALLSYANIDTGRNEFVDKVIEIADLKFEKAISFSDKNEAALWNRYLLESAKSQQQKLDQVLQAVIAIDKRFSLFTTSDNGLDVKLKIPDDGEQKQTTSLPSPDLAKIEKYQGKRRCIKLWDDIWTGFKTIEKIEEELRNLKQRQGPARPLNEMEEREIKELNKNLADLQEESDKNVEEFKTSCN